MNKQPIEAARDPDLRLSSPAMHRAALRARQLAAQTRTDLVVSEHGVLRKIHPANSSLSQQVQEPLAAYDDKA